MSDDDRVEQDRVRRTLADAHADAGPMPADVAERLDEVLAGLVDERGSTRVVPLRRRVGPVVLAAAALAGVVAVGGIGLSKVLSESGENATFGATGDRALTEDVATGPQAPTPDGTAGQSESAPAYAAQDAAGTVTMLSSERFADDAARLMRSVGSASTELRGLDETTGQTGRVPPPAVTDAPLSRVDALTRTAGTCPGPTRPGAVTVPVQLDGEPAALVFAAPDGDEQRVEAWSCDGTTLLASADVATSGS